MTTHDTTKTKTKTKKKATAAAPAATAVRKTAHKFKARPVTAGCPPDGPVTAASVDLECLAWGRAPAKTKHDYVVYRPVLILRDARKMLGGRADLPLFAEKKAPVTARDFDRLELLTTALERIGPAIVAARAARLGAEREAVVVLDHLKKTHTLLARWGATAGIHPSLLKLRIAGLSLRALWANIEAVVSNARGLVAEFHDPDVANAHIDALAEAGSRSSPSPSGRRRPPPSGSRPTRVARR